MSLKLKSFTTHIMDEIVKLTANEPDITINDVYLLVAIQCISRIAKNESPEALEELLNSIEKSVENSLKKRSS